MPEIVLSGSHPDADPILVQTAETTVSVLEGAYFNFGWKENGIHNFGIGSWFTATDLTIDVMGVLSSSLDFVISVEDSSGARIHVGASGALDATQSSTFAIWAAGDVLVTNEGRITAHATGIDISDPLAAIVINDGLISGSTAVEFYTQQTGTSATLVNRGTLLSTGAFEARDGRDGQALYLSGSLVTVNNSGEILAHDADVAALLVASDFDMVDTRAILANSGTIRSDLSWAIDLATMVGTSRITNSGTIHGGEGAILGSAGADTVINRGIIEGDVRLGAGDDVFDGSAYGSQGMIHGGAGNDSLVGGDTGESLFGGSGNDTLNGSPGSDAFDGGAGVDTLVYGYPENLQAIRVDLAAGTVTLGGITESVVRIEDVETGQGDDTFVGNSAANHFDGGFGDDTFSGGAGRDTLVGDEGDDVFDGGGGSDSISGGAGNDTVLYTANTGAVRVDLLSQRVTFPGTTWLAEKLDTIESATTGSGDDVLIGSGAGNHLRGMAGDDTLQGGNGTDHLTGGAGHDVFVYKAWVESNAEHTDQIVAGDGGLAFDGAGAAAGDLISLADVDANADLPGNQAFVFGGRAAGHLWLEDVGDVTYAHAVIDEIGLSLEIAIYDGAVRASAYTADDFLL